MKISKLVFTGLALAALLNAAVAQDSKDPVVIRLGDEEVTLSEFNQDFEVAVRLLAARQGIPYGKQPPETVARLKQQFLGQRAGELALLREAERRGITVSEEEIDSQVAEFRASLGGDQDFQATLEEAGFSSEAQLREMAREKQVIGRLTEALLDEIKIPPGDVVVLHHDVKEHMATPEQICVRHIVVEAQSDANALITELKQGADFASLALERSKESASAPRGGDIGCFAREGVVAKSAFEKAAFNAAEGEVTGPVKSEFGYHVLMVYDGKPSHVPSLNEAYAELEKELKHEKLPAKLMEIRQNSAVETFPDRL